MELPQAGTRPEPDFGDQLRGIDSPGIPVAALVLVRDRLSPRGGADSPSRSDFLAINSFALGAPIERVDVVGPVAILETSPGPRGATQEGRWAILIAATAVLLSSGPRLFLYLTTPGDRVFLGQVWGVYDIPRYVLLIRQAAGGAWLFDNRLQGPSHTSFLLYTPYILLGHLLGWTGMSPLAMMEAGRWIAMPSALAASWLFIRRALPPGQRALGYFAAVLAGGLGLLVLASRPMTLLGPVVPLDITGPSFTVMNSLNMAPHVAVAVACLALFGWGLLAASEGEWRGLLGGAALAGVATFHSFVVPMALIAGSIWRSVCHSTASRAA